MRVFIAPDSFGSTLSADQAAHDIATGWSTVRKGDELIVAPQSDGGPGFIDVLASVTGTVIVEQILGPLGEEVNAPWLWHSESQKAYIESAKACGLALLPGKATKFTAVAASTYGVGQLVLAAYQHGAQQIIIGLGGSCTTDGGRGFIEAIAGLERGAITDNVYDADNWPSARLAFDRARSNLTEYGSVELIAASDVDNPLVGLSGAAYMFGPQKGARGTVISELEVRNIRWGNELSVASNKSAIANCPGGGAAGGLGAAILALGGKFLSGADVIAQATGRAERIKRSDLVITGEGKLDVQSEHGKVVWSIARTAQEYGVPVVIIAGQVTIAQETLDQWGVARAFSLAEHAGSVERAMNEASKICVSLAARVARDWNNGYIIGNNKKY